MDREAVKQYLENEEEGKALLEELKKPLISKRDELLSLNKQLHEKLTGETQRATDAAKLLEDERKAVRSMVVDQRLDAMMEEHAVIPSLRTIVKQKLLSENDIDVHADGTTRKAIVRHDENEKPLEEWFKSWTETDEARQVMLNLSSGGGAIGSDFTTTHPPEESEYSQRVFERINKG